MVVARKQREVANHYVNLLIVRKCEVHLKFENLKFEHLKFENLKIWKSRLRFLSMCWRKRFVISRETCGVLKTKGYWTSKGWGFEKNISMKKRFDVKQPFDDQKFVRRQTSFWRWAWFWWQKAASRLKVFLGQNSFYVENFVDVKNLFDVKNVLVSKRMIDVKESFDVKIVLSCVISNNFDMVSQKPSL